MLIHLRDRVAVEVIAEADEPAGTRKVFTNDWREWLAHYEMQVESDLEHGKNVYY
jgi:hypothetical protein